MVNRLEYVTPWLGKPREGVSADGVECGMSTSSISVKTYEFKLPSPPVQHQVGATAELARASAGLNMQCSRCVGEVRDWDTEANVLVPYSLCQLVAPQRSAHSTGKHHSIILQSILDFTLAQGH